MSHTPQSDSPHAQPLPDRVQWRVIAPLSLTTLFAFMGGTTLAPLAADIAGSLDTNVSLIAQVMTISLVVMGLAGLISGPLSDHMGQRRSILLGLAFLLPSMALYAGSLTYPMLLLGGALTGIAGALTIGPAFGLAAGSFRGNARQIAISRVQAAGTLGMIAGAPIATTIASLTSWRGWYVVMGVCYAVTFALLVRLMPPDPPRKPGWLSVHAILGAYRPLLQHRVTVSLLSGTLLRSFAWFGPFFFLGAYLIDAHDLSLRQVGLIYMAASCGQFLGNVAAGGRASRADQRVVYGVSTLALGLAWAGVYTLEPGPLVVTVLTTLAAFATGIGWISLQSMLASQTPTGLGTSMTLNVSISAFGWALGSAAGGLLVAWLGYQVLGILAPPLAVAAAAVPLLALLRPDVVAVEEPVG